MQSIDWTGPVFLALYGLLAIGAVILAELLRGRVIRGTPRPERFSELNPLEIALLHGGEERVVATAILTLRQRGELSVEGRLVMKALVRPATGQLPLEQSLIRAIDRGPRAIHELRGLLANDMRGLRAELERDGLWLSERDRLRATRVVLVPAAVVALGLVASILGFLGGEPILPLVLMAAALSIYCFRFGSPPLRTAAGEALVKKQQREYAEVLQTVSTSDRGHPAEVGIATAVFGPLALSGASPIGVFPAEAADSSGVSAR